MNFALPVPDTVAVDIDGNRREAGFGDCLLKIRSGNTGNFMFPGLPAIDQGDCLDWFYGNPLLG